MRGHAGGHDGGSAGGCHEEFPFIFTASDLGELIGKLDGKKRRSEKSELVTRNHEVPDSV
jgi:hypothetical protein